MIARVWNGWTSASNADAYERLLLTRILPGIQARQIAGYRGAFLYRRQVPDGYQFVTTMLFDSVEAIRAFAGAQYEVAVVPAEARALLSRFDERSAHYDVPLAPPLAMIAPTRSL